ncbi:bifunctional RecB family nuclease/DEAD/DEAH box helicase [Falsigemmobacter faecalis]|uniref:Nuclease n=1 Tax=Falsigemmobacter faecalis TaxID=2488730 RepID=A0A3P3DSN8_9RHOB|nr:AAA domain-containing protein [Falsigemmobacter faecalis]RRH77270.1 nuclease [Falsigemmobacter faecalis]
MSALQQSPLVTATDLLRFSACAHASALDLQDIAAAPPEAGLSEAAEATLRAMRRGEALVSDPVFLTSEILVRADFLQRVGHPSRLGAFSYEPGVIRPGPPTPAEIMTLALCADLLAIVQGNVPRQGHISAEIGGCGPVPLQDYLHYTRSLHARLRAFATDPPVTRPQPCAACDTCRWQPRCAAGWEAADSLYQLPGLRRGQVKKLEAAGVQTLTALAELTAPPRGFGEGTTAGLAARARLHLARARGQSGWEPRPASPGQGFDLLPEPQEGDLFYALSGETHALRLNETTRLYGPGGTDLSALPLDLKHHFDSFPRAQICHFGTEPLTALKRLMIALGTGEAFLDRLLRERRLTDLAAVLRGAFLSAKPPARIRDLAGFAGEAPSAAEPSPEEACRLTGALRDWLLQRRPDRPWPQPAPEAAEKESFEESDSADLRRALAASDLPPARQAMLFDLGLFHQREAKPAQWAVFESLSKDEDALLEDLNALAGLRAIGPPEPVKRSFQRSYRFAPQETKLRAGKRATLPVSDGPPASVTIEALDRRAGRITLKAGPGKAALLSDHLSLHPDWPLETKVLAAALRDVIDDQCGPRSYRAVDDLLARRAPRLHSGELQTGPDPLSAVIAATTAMDQSLLPIQGPPGTGKTYVTARAILALLRQGARVGVTSNSHEAIRNVLTGCLSAAAEESLPCPIDIVHKTSGSEDGYPADSPVRRTGSNDEAAGGRQIVGATAWFFCRDENIQAFDWLFVDEAGQVGLANMAAMGRAAKNIVLVGDPQQLPQVIQGAHPDPAGRSCLEWMIGEGGTVTPDRGIFLSVSRRMHPQVCGFISDQVYGGRLESHPETADQGVTGTRYPQAGAFFVPLAHEGNTQIAPEEAEAIRVTVAELLSGQWQGKTGAPRPLSLRDIMVVAPFNAQVNALREVMPQGIRVGTVDTFQGQEAPVCLVSMTASSAEESARGMDFLLSLNRINVAVSRAKGLALVFGASRLREAACTTVEEMRLVNTLCALPLCPAPAPERPDL